MDEEDLADFRNTIKRKIHDDKFMKHLVSHFGRNLQANATSGNATTAANVTNATAVTNVTNATEANATEIPAASGASLPSINATSNGTACSFNYSLSVVSEMNATMNSTVHDYYIDNFLNFLNGTVPLDGSVFNCSNLFNANVISAMMNASSSDVSNSTNATTANATVENSTNATNATATNASEPVKNYDYKAMVSQLQCDIMMYKNASDYLNQIRILNISEPLHRAIRKNDVIFVVKPEVLNSTCNISYLIDNATFVAAPIKI